MPKKIRRTKPVTPVVINRTTKEWVGYLVMADGPDNAALTAYWDVPQDDGTIKREAVPLDAEPIRAMSGFDAIVDAIVAASE